MVASQSYLTANGDIPFLHSHSPFFFIKNGLKLLNEKVLEWHLYVEKLKHEVGLKAAKRIIVFEIAPHLK